MKQWITSLIRKVLPPSLCSKTIPQKIPKGVADGHSVKEPKTSSDEPTVAKETPVYMNPYDQFLEHLELREGVRYECYEDSLGKLTAGVGHLLPADTELCVGSPVSKEQVAQWLQEDSQLSWANAISQARLLGRYDHAFIIGLASVNFQLGVHWNLIHKKTWHYLEQGRWKQAAAECADSKWNKQTPVRVADFQEAIMSYY